MYVVRDLQCGIILAGLTVFDEVVFFFFHRIGHKISQFSCLAWAALHLVLRFM